MTLFVFVFAVAMVLTVMSLSPKNLRHYPNYNQQSFEHKRNTSFTSEHTESRESPLITLMYTIIFVGAMLAAMYALA